MPAELSFLIDVSVGLMKLIMQYGSSHDLYWSVTARFLSPMSEGTISRFIFDKCRENKMNRLPSSRHVNE